MSAGYVTPAPTYTCDDCRREFPGRPYYTFDPEHCMDIPIAAIASPHGEDCTGNLCPTCAGPFLVPDDPNDPRRPTD